MIRTTIALFVLAVLICGLIVFRPFSGGDDVATDRLGTPIETGADVTRNRTPEAGALALAAVAGAGDPVASTTTGAVNIQPTTTAPRASSRQSELEAITNSVLADLGFEGVQPAPTDTQRQSTSDILAGIEAATGQHSVLEQQESLETIVIAALRAGETDQSIDTIVNAAATAGTVAVPDILMTSDGRVDTAVMLQNIITQAQIVSGGPAPAVPNITPQNTAGVEIRMEQRANENVPVRYYTVQDGDSLGSISIKFYGAVTGFDNIFEANQALLSSPDVIRAGQQLLIP